MGTFAANNITTWFGGYDMTADLNQTTMPIEFEALISTTFGPAGTRTAHSRRPGLESVSSSVNGFWEAGDGLVDEQAFNALGGAVQVITHSHDGAEGSPAYFYQARAFTYQLFGDVGAMAPFTLSAEGSKSNGAVGAIRGVVLKTKADVAATGATGTSNQLGAVGTDQYLYCAVHAFSVGTTLTLQIQSDNSAGFASPTTQMTIGPITTTGGTWATRVGGPITDDFWRVNVSAITGTSQIAVVVGIK